MVKTSEIVFNEWDFLGIQWPIEDENEESEARPILYLGWGGEGAREFEICASTADEIIKKMEVHERERGTRRSRRVYRVPKKKAAKKAKAK